MTSGRHDLQASIEHARSVADAVLYEGYLLYPYRATSSKNRVRWQFGVLGPRGAADAGLGEQATMCCEFLMRLGAPISSARMPTLTAHVRFLQHQTRSVERLEGNSFSPVEEITIADQRWLTWDEAVEGDVEVGPWTLADLVGGRQLSLVQAGGHEVEDLADPAGRTVGRVVRRRSNLSGELSLQATDLGAGSWRIRLEIENSAGSQADTVQLDTVQLDREGAISASFIGTHVVIVAEGADFISSADPPDDLRQSAAALERHRCWPVLAGPVGETRILLVSPIIVEDNAELAPQSAGALFDSTEIDEILTLRVMTLTDEEKAEARATDPKAAEIIDRCDQMTPQQMQDLHGILRNPHGGPVPTDLWPDAFDAPAFDSYDLPDDLVFTTDAPWWNPEADASVSPETDSVVIDGVNVSAGSIVAVKPNRRADAQDLFYAGMTARVTAVLNDVDGDTHVAVVLVDDPASEMHDWYGRYLYFSPDELVPLAEADSKPPDRGGDPG